MPVRSLHSASASEVFPVPIGPCSRIMPFGVDFKFDSASVLPTIASVLASFIDCHNCVLIVPPVQFSIELSSCRLLQNAASACPAATPPLFAKSWRQQGGPQGSAPSACRMLGHTSAR